MKYPKFSAFKRPRGFEGLIRLITEQQLSVASARAVFLRIKRLMPIFSPKEFLKIKNSDLKKTGLSGPKINYCKILANEISSGKLSFRSLHKLSDDALKKRYDPMRAWTINTKDDPFQLINGLGQLINIQFLHIQKPK